jgi:hypothetical protein
LASFEKKQHGGQLSQICRTKQRIILTSLAKFAMSTTAATAEKLSKNETTTLETLPFDYQWPQDNAGEYYQLERQVCEFLKEKSLLQKYPQMQHHEVSKEERKFLFEQGTITEAEFNDDKKVQKNYKMTCFATETRPLQVDH